jgi:hypothetical protein
LGGSPGFSFSKKPKPMPAPTVLTLAGLTREFLLTGWLQPRLSALWIVASSSAVVVVSVIQQLRWRHAKGAAYLLNGGQLRVLTGVFQARERTSRKA